jgi:hypothetical protein
MPNALQKSCPTWFNQLAKYLKVHGAQIKYNGAFINARVLDVRWTDTTHHASRELWLQCCADDGIVFDVEVLLFRHLDWSSKLFQHGEDHVVLQGEALDKALAPDS